MSVAESRQRLTLLLASADVPSAEALVELAGAEAVSLRDAADDPVLEPAPSTAPLWPSVRLHALFASHLDLAPLLSVLAASFPSSAATVDVLPEAAWHVRDAVKARPIGARLWLAPADSETAPHDRALVRIHMGLAFGTGEHPTTGLCLEWIERRVANGSTLLDYGCGSGVLAVAALKLGARFAYAVDNDAQALLATRANAQLNGVADRLFTFEPEKLPTLRVDMLAANILAGPLVELAPTFAASVLPGGVLVLSGILEAQVTTVAAAYAAAFDRFEQTAREGWVRLTARRRFVNSAQTR